MSDPAAEIRHLLGRYEQAQSARDATTLSELHWQDPRFVHVWSPGSVDVGWQGYEQRLGREFDRFEDIVFRLADVRLEVFGGRFAVVTARWRCEYRRTSEEPGASAGPVTFVLSKMGNSWKIVADHFSVS